MKKSLNERLYGHDDYSIFAQERTFKKYPLNEILKDTGTYHADKTQEALKLLTALNELTIEEYFRYQLSDNLLDPIRSLQRQTAFSKISYDKLSKTKMSEVFRIIGGLRNTSDDYEAFDEIEDCCWILMKPIIDSKYRHPLYTSTCKHFRDAAYELTHDKRCRSSEIKRKIQLQNMNRLVQKITEDCYPLGDPKAQSWMHYYNNILMPCFAISTR